MRVLAVCFVLITCLFWPLPLLPNKRMRPIKPQPPPAISPTAKKSSVQYNTSVMSDKDQPHNGRVWLPGGSPMTLFTQVPLI